MKKTLCLILTLGILLSHTITMADGNTASVELLPFSFDYVSVLDVYMPVVVDLTQIEGIKDKIQLSSEVVGWSSDYMGKDIDGNYNPISVTGIFQSANHRLSLTLGIDNKYNVEYDVTITFPANTLKDIQGNYIDTIYTVKFGTNEYPGSGPVSYFDFGVEKLLWDYENPKLSIYFSNEIFYETDYNKNLISFSIGNNPYQPLDESDYVTSYGNTLLIFFSDAEKFRNTFGNATDVKIEISDMMIYENSSQSPNNNITIDSKIHFKNNQIITDSMSYTTQNYKNLIPPLAVYNKEYNRIDVAFNQTFCQYNLEGSIKISKNSGDFVSLENASILPDSGWLDHLSIYFDEPVLNNYGDTIQLKFEADSFFPKLDNEMVTQIIANNDRETYQFQIGNKNFISSKSGEIIPIEKDYTLYPTTPLIIGNRTLLPIRCFVEAIGGNIEWNDTEKKVTIGCNENNIELWIDNPVAKVNSIEQTLDVAPQIINDRTMLPLRFISENLGFDVQWVEESQIVILTQKWGTTI